MNITADHIYQELLALPESKLVEIQQFIEFVKFKKQDDMLMNKPSEQSIAVMFQELRQLCNEEDYEFEIPPRVDRKNTYADD